MKPFSTTWACPKCAERRAHTRTHRPVEHASGEAGTIRWRAPADSADIADSAGPEAEYPCNRIACRNLVAVEGDWCGLECNAAVS